MYILQAMKLQPVIIFIDEIGKWCVTVLCYSFLHELKLIITIMTLVVVQFRGPTYCDCKQQNMCLSAFILSLVIMFRILQIPS